MEKPAFTETHNILYFITKYIIVILRLHENVTSFCVGWEGGGRHIISVPQTPKCLASALLPEPRTRIPALRNYCSEFKVRLSNSDICGRLEQIASYPNNSQFITPSILAMHSIRGIRENLGRNSIAFPSMCAKGVRF